MKRAITVLRTLVGILLITLFIPLYTSAAVPQQITYQGQLTDATGNPVPDGDYEMSFALYDVPTGGTALWSEAQTVTVTNGIYNVTLGQSENELDPADFVGDLYLGVTVGADSEMSPRQPLTSVGYALRAHVADTVKAGAVTTIMLQDAAVATAKLADNAITESKLGDATVTATKIQDGATISEIMDDDGAGSGLDADMLDGLHASSFLTAETDPQVGGNAVNYVPKWNGSALVKGSIYDNNRVGIGTTNPTYTLDVSGFDNALRVTEISGADTVFAIRNYGEVTFTYGPNEYARIDADGGPAGYVQLSYIGEPTILLHSNGNSYFGVGNLGIGTTSPLAGLHVDRSGSSLSPSALLNEDLILEDGDAVLGLYSDEGGNYGSALSLAELHAADGNLTNKWSMYRTTGNTSVPEGLRNQLRFSFGTNANYAANPVALSIAHNGNVGINTTSPGERLHVSGNLKLDGDLRTDRWLGSATNTFIGEGVVGAGNLTHTEGFDGWYNTAIGGHALYSNTTGNINTAVGDDALFKNTTGYENTAIGGAALAYNTTGYYNTAVGEGAGFYSGGSRNVFLGYKAGLNATGSNKLYIANSDTSTPLIYGEFDNELVTLNGELTVKGKDGFNANGEEAALHLGTVHHYIKGVYGSGVKIGTYAAGDVIHVKEITGNVGIGTDSPGSYKLAVNGSAYKTDGSIYWNTSSDTRLKDVEGDYEYGLEEVDKLQPVRFRYKEGNALDLPTDNEHVGLLAQDVHRVIPEAVSEDTSGYLTLNGTPIHYAMLNAIKELKAEVAYLKKRVEELEHSQGQ